jgi:hypothetical protein
MRARPSSTADTIARTVAHALAHALADTRLRVSR